MWGTMRPPIADAVAGGGAALLATAVYAVARQDGRAWASSWPGHLLGVAGILLMLFAAVDYGRRKRALAAPDTTMRDAMRLHVVAGLLGPYLVILHSGFAFGGLAGVLSLVMVVVVGSGIVGRALYTAVPRHVGVADPVRAAMLDAELARLELASADLLRQGDPDPARREALRHEMLNARHQEEVLRATWRANGPAESWRRLLRLWWYLHSPMSAALWVLAAVHVVAALWYATLSR